MNTMSPTPKQDSDRKEKMRCKSGCDCTPTCAFHDGECVWEVDDGLNDGPEEKPSPRPEWDGDWRAYKGRGIVQHEIEFIRTLLEQAKREERERISKFHKCTCETCIHYGIRDCLVNLGCNRCNPNP